MGIQGVLIVDEEVAMGESEFVMVVHEENEVTANESDLEESPVYKNILTIQISFYLSYVDIRLLARQNSSY